MDEIIYSSAASLAYAIRTGEISSEEIIDTHLQRIEKVNPGLNAIVQLTAASFIPGKDATVVARMRAAGAILLGKTNLPELGLAYETDNLVYGRTVNPYDTSRTPGGSSGGEAAIIAAGGSPLGLGNDIGGIPPSLVSPQYLPKYPLIFNSKQF